MGENNSGSTLILDAVAEQSEAQEREVSPEPIFANAPWRLRKRPSAEEAKEIGRRGREIYQKLRCDLEASYNGQFLVIATDTEEFAISETVTAATDTILNNRPDAPLYGLRIGDDVLGRI